MDVFNDILQPYIRASKIKLSYIEELFPDLKDNPYIVLHKNVPNVQPTDRRFQDREESFDDSTKHDVSGSPLEYSFGNCEFDDTIVMTKHNWWKEEEFYLPLSRIDACNALNKCLEHFDDNTLPILALCDGKDPKQSRLIGSIVCNDWFTTLEAISIGTATLATIVKNSNCKLIEEHLGLSFAHEHDIIVSTLNIFDLFGTKQEKIDWDKSVESDFEGSISVEVHKNSVLISPLPKDVLIIQINAGWKNSPLKELRSQLFLLIQYLSLIDENEKNTELQNPIKFAMQCSEEYHIMIKKLNLLLNGDISFRPINKIDSINQENSEINIKLLTQVQNVSLRHDIDFTDFLWEILKETSEYSQIINCIKTVLEEIVENKFVPQINDTNSTRFVKRISDVHHQETISHLLVGSVPLELAIDMGFEKLTRDYLYILRGAQLIDLQDIRQKLIDVSSGLFNRDNYRKNLITLAQIHICLECMLLIERHLECPVETLQSIFASAYKEFLSEQSPLQDYNELSNRFYTLTVPLPNAIAMELHKTYPIIWRASVSSHSIASRLTTMTYYSKMPIFPTNIYPTDDINAHEEIAYGISIVSSSMKYKRL